MCPQRRRWQVSISLFFSRNTPLLIPQPSAGSLHCAKIKPDSATATHELMAEFSYVVIMLKKGMIVKESACRIRYSKGVDDIRLEGHDAALFI